MGLLYADAMRLLKASETGVSFERTLTVSRQQIYLHDAELEALRGRLAAKGPVLQGYRFGEFADRFWHEVIGVRHLETIDNSDYEGATIVHDLNHPVPESLYEGFDAVVEAGSLEHIFNFPVAIANLMKMVRTGGRLFLTTVANNLCGHGFYQFSPELIYRVLSPDNGFDETSVVLFEGASPSVELSPVYRYYTVTDPMTLGRRVGLQNSNPAMMMVAARKRQHVEPFRSTPQQSDYIASWGKSQAGAAAPDPAAGRSAARRLVAAAFRRLPVSWKRKVEMARLRREYSLTNRNFYRSVS